MIIAVLDYKYRETDKDKHETRDDHCSGFLFLAINSTNSRYAMWFEIVLCC